MKRSLLFIAAAVFMFSGCDKLLNREASAKKRAAAEEAAAAAAARFAGRGKAAAASQEETKAGEAMVDILCSSPRLVADIQENMDLLAALSGEGVDRSEAEHQRMFLKKRYRATMESALTARGSSYESFLSYASRNMPSDAGRKEKLRALISGRCPGADHQVIEKAAGNIMKCCTAGSRP